MKQRGRPPKEINWDLVERYIEVGCSGVEIAAKFRIQKQTFYERFKREYNKNFQDYHTDCDAGCKADIRLSLVAKAINNKSQGNATILIFLARTMLGMREPELISNDSPFEDSISLRHENMILRDEVRELREKMNDNNS